MFWSAMQNECYLAVVAFASMKRYFNTPGKEKAISEIIESKTKTTQAVKEKSQRTPVREYLESPETEVCRKTLSDKCFFRQLRN